MNNNSVVLVTGANAGMGKAASLAFAKQGASVVMLCRDPERGKKALEDVKRESGNERVELMICDLSSVSSIENACAQFIKTHSRLDVLVNNAGVLKTRRYTTQDGFELHFGVNHLGHFLLTNRLLPLLKQSAPSRIVVVSSCAQRVGRIRFDDLNLKKHFAFWRGYPQSKLANVLFTYELARRLEGTDVTVNCLDPGIVATDIIINRKTGFGKTLVRLQRLICASSEKGAETAVYLASSPEAGCVTGKFFKNKKEIRSCRRSYDEEAARRLWEVSEQMTGLKPCEPENAGFSVYEPELLAEEETESGESVAPSL